RDSKIPYKKVRVVDSETRKPGPPLPLADVLLMLKRQHPTKQDRTETTHYAEVVAPPSDATDGFALVRLYNKKEQMARAKAARHKLMETRKRIEYKEVQMTWNIAAGDFDHKMRKVRDEIARGYRVNLAFASKSGQQSPSPQEMNAKITEAVDALQDVAREWMPRDRRRDVTVVFLQDKER
ncbi:hypothetical protein BV25DRAFT_1773021, partial [Artomyces pyxidatus]